MKTLFLLSLGLIFSACGNSHVAPTEDYMHMHEDGSGHIHEVTDHETAPDAPSTIALMVHPDTMSGVNVHVKTENFTFSPDMAGSDHILGHGHGHLYLNGKKIARLYGAWFHIPDVPKGTHTISVSLHNNTHGYYLLDGEKITASQEITIE